MRKLLFEGLTHAPLTEPPPAADEEVATLARTLDAAARKRLGRSLAIRQVDAGSCNGCELEIHALGNVFYDLERFGLRFVASPRHADVLLVTGPVTKNMAEALARTYAATPDPKWVVAVGACALDGGAFCGVLCGRWRRCGGRARRSCSLTDVRRLPQRSFRVCLRSCGAQPGSLRWTMELIGKQRPGSAGTMPAPPRAETMVRYLKFLARLLNYGAIWRI